MADNDFIHWAIDGLITIASGVFIYLLRRRDDSQAQEMKDMKEALSQKVLPILENVKDLYDKHNADSDRLHTLEIDVAKNFFSKEEVIKMFDDQRRYFDQRFDRLEKLLDKNSK